MIMKGKIFRKDDDANEEAIYKILGSHPRIVHYLGTDDHTGEIMLPLLQNGDLFSYLISHTNIPIAARLTWAVEIVQGLAHLHARDVIWADPHLCNILLTDEYHVVLCDFGLSIHNAPYYYKFARGPPPIYLCPLGYYGESPRRVDIFGLGVILFVLLSERFPFLEDLKPSIHQQFEVLQEHHRICLNGGSFDMLSPSLHPYFGDIVAKCFNIKYQSADVLLTELQAAFSKWWEDNIENIHDVPSSVAVNYPQKPVYLPIEVVQHKYTPEPWVPQANNGDDEYGYEN